MMERVHEELEEAKVEIEKLREEIKAKSVLSETLKRAHNEQLTKVQEANAKVEKQVQELNEKEDEIGAMKQMYEEIKLSVKEKESLIKHLGSTIDKLRITSDERLSKFENEKMEILEKLDEANSKNLEKEQEISTYKEEIRVLKSVSSALENKCVEEERRAKALKELGQREDSFFKLEEESRKVEDQLKWKKEQFKHLEEAHKKLRHDYKASEKQWEKEKSTLLDEMYKLQDKLDTQTRKSEDLQSRLEMCHQALAHEESRRKVLEVKFSETKTHLGNVVSECEEARMEIEALTGKRDQEIARMRDLLSKREFANKEMEYRVGRLEQENEELKISVKEFQEAQIHEKGASSSLSKLQSKLKRLEQAHKDCSKNLIEKEAEWGLKLEMMEENLLVCKSELDQKNDTIKELEINCERLDRIHRNCSQNLFAKEAEWSAKLEKVVEDLTYWKSELENKAGLVKELEIKCEGLDQAHRDCSLTFKSKEAEWTAKLDDMAEDLTNCKNGLEAKDKVLRELEMRCELLDQVHRDCSMKLKSKETEWTLQSEKMVEELVEGRTQLERKDNVIRELEMKCESSDQVHRDCSTKLEAKEVEWTLQTEKLVEELVECRTQLESKDEAAKDLKLRMEILDQMYRDCSENLKLKEAEWAQSDDLERELSDNRDELECKRDSLKHLEAELEELKQINRDLTVKLRAKEAEFGPHLVKLADDLVDLRKEIEGKDEVMKELQMALENSNSSNMLLELQNEENSLTLIVFKSVISDMNLHIRQREKDYSLLINQLEMKNEALVRAQKQIEDNDENIVSLRNLKSELETDLRKVNQELAEKFYQENEYESELYIWRSIAEKLSSELEELKKLRRELEISLLRQIEVEDSLKHENENLVNAIEEKSKLVECLEEELNASQEKSGNEKQEASFKSLEESEGFMKEWLSREIEGVILAHSKAERVLEQEKAEFSKRIGKKQEELNSLLKAWEKIATDELAKEIEIQEKTLVISELETDLETLQRKFDLQQKDLSKLLDFVGSFSEKLGSLSVEDMKLVSSLEKIAQKCVNEVDELYDPSKENMDISSPLVKRTVETSVDGRSPLRSLNH